MPAPEMFPPARTLRKISLDLEDLTLDCVDGVRLEVRLEFSDGLRATVLSRIFVDDDAADLPQNVRALGDAFLWGENAKQILEICQRLDRAAQSRRVRSTL